jgi:hypothetical protein
MQSKNSEPLRIDNDFLNIRCIELLRIKALKKNGLVYFENIID